MNSEYDARVSVGKKEKKTKIVIYLCNCHHRRSVPFDLLISLLQEYLANALCIVSPRDNWMYPSQHRVTRKLVAFGVQASSCTRILAYLNGCMVVNIQEFA